MEDMPVLASPMEMIRYWYAIMITNYLTGWVEVYPTRDQLALEIICLFTEEFMPWHGQPWLVINNSDQGFPTKCGLIFFKWPTFVSHSQYCVMQFNRTFKELLNKSILNQPDTWPDCLLHLLSAYSRTTSDVTALCCFIHYMVVMSMCHYRDFYQMRDRSTIG